MSAIPAHRPHRVSGTLTVTVETDEIVAISLHGEFDLATAPQIVAQTGQALADDNHVIIDLDEATFIDSSVINALFHAKKTAEQRGSAVVLQLRAAGVADHILALTGVEQVLPRTHTRIEAVRRIYQLAASPEDGS